MINGQKSPARIEPRSGWKKIKLEIKGMYDMVGIMFDVSTEFLLKRMGFYKFSWKTVFTAAWFNSVDIYV